MVCTEFSFRGFIKSPMGVISILGLVATGAALFIASKPHPIEYALTPYSLSNVPLTSEALCGLGIGNDLTDVAGEGKLLDGNIQTLRFSTNNKDWIQVVLADHSNDSNLRGRDSLKMTIGGRIEEVPNSFPQKCLLQDVTIESFNN
jgi:hypothetical protein